MKVGIIQIHSIPEAVDDNLKRGLTFFSEAVEKGADIIAFPELWSCGYYLETEGFKKAVEKNEEILNKFKELSRIHKVMTLLPLPILEEDKLYIGEYLIESNGEVIATYRKSNLWGREQNYFTPGEKDYEVIETSLGKMGVLICYDIEFPEPARILALKGAEIIFAPAVWSIPAENRWNIQLPARALDNTLFMVGINTVEEGACVQSKVVSPLGEVLAEASPDKEEVVVCDIDLSYIEEVRKNIPYLREFDMCLCPGGDII